MTEAQKIKVVVADNYHYQDESEFYDLALFDDIDAALDACRKLVDEFLTENHQVGMSHDELYSKYTMFGEDPFIVAPGVDGVRFSAWDYAKARCQQICS